MQKSHGRIHVEIPLVFRPNPQISTASHPSNLLGRERRGASGSLPLTSDESRCNFQDGIDRKKYIYIYYNILYDYIDLILICLCVCGVRIYDICMYIYIYIAWFIVAHGRSLQFIVVRQVVPHISIYVSRVHMFPRYFQHLLLALLQSRNGKASSPDFAGPLGLRTHLLVMCIYTASMIHCHENMWGLP